MPIKIGMRDQSAGYAISIEAEDVAAIEPLLVTYNDKGQVEGVKYDRIGVVLINAIKEQQSQIDSQQAQIEMQQSQIAALKQLVCSEHKESALCKE